MALDDSELRILEERLPPASGANDFVVIGCTLGAALCGLGFAVTLLAGAPLVAYGSLLALAAFLLAIAVRRYFTGRYPDVVAAEPRSALAATPEETAPVAAIQPLDRRPVLTRLLVAAAGVFGISLLGLVPSLGPSVGNRLRRTPWRDGLAVVNDDGQRIRPEEVAVGGIVTGWPEGDIGFERAAVVVLRLATPPEAGMTNMGWVLDETVVAYSKICTHAGCPVALFRERQDALFCPCHQSTFDARRGAVPIFGPAARALPQLPLGVDDDGYLIALGDFPHLPGPPLG